MSDERAHEAGAQPAVIGRYQITGTLGSGAMGAVYKAFDPLIKRTLAIKTIRLDVPRQSPHHRSFLERFYLEARISGTLSHPGIVTLFDVGEEDGLPFLAMEFIEGSTIAAMLDEGIRFKPERVIGIVSQVAAALDYAHSQGVIHRDIKPSNLMLSAGDKVKVTDFGIAKLADAEITHSGALVGTPAYMSPEQAMGEKLDGRSDIFSLGVCAFEMLSGEQPFPGSNVTAILYKLVHVDPIEPADLEASGLVPQKWRDVFNKALAKKPEKRYQTATAFVQDLEYCLGSWFAGLGPEATPPAAEPVPLLPTPVLPAQNETRSGTAEVQETVMIARPVVPMAEGETKVLRPVPPPIGDVGPTVVMPAPRVPKASFTLPPVPELVPPPAVPARRPTARRALPIGWILGGAAFVVSALALAGWAILGGAGPGPAPEALPTAEASPAPVEPVSLPTTGSLRVAAEPAGTRVLVNGDPRGETPLELVGLAFGVYEVRLESRGYDPQVREVQLSATAPEAEVRTALQRTARPVEAGGLADLVSTPSGARVSIDGRPVGRTPLTGVQLQPGPRRIDVALEGHEPWSTTIEVTPGRKERVDIRLRPLPSPVASSTPVPFDASKTYQNTASDVDVLARKVSGVSPSYPSDRAPRLRSGERVSVTVRFLVDDVGDVHDVQVLGSAGPAIDEVVISAVRGWKFQPATKRGLRVKVEVTFKQTFLGG